MKIWLLTTEYPPFYGGGIATYCFHTARMLSSYGHEVTVFLQDTSLCDSHSVSRDGKTRVVRFKPGEREVYKYLGYVAALSYDFAETVKEYIRREGGPDLIECQDYLGIGYFLLHQKKVLYPELKDIPVLLTLHTPKFLVDKYDRAPAYRFPDFWTGEMERFAMRAADALISPSKYLLERLAGEVRLDDKNCRVIPHPFVMTETEANGEIFFFDRNDVVFLGRVQYLKGIEHAIKYFRELWEEGWEIPLKIIGGETFFYPKGKKMGVYLREKYKKYFRRGLIEFEGIMPPRNLYARLSRAHVVIVPSLLESFSYAVVESMSLEKVVLASDSGGQREIIKDGENGFLFSHTDPDQFRNKLSHILQAGEQEIMDTGRRAGERVRELCAYSSVYRQKIKIMEELSENSANSRVFPFIRTGFKAGERTIDSREQKDLLSIVIPYFNMGNYVRDTLDSLMQITYPQKEIIIVNDGTDDPRSLAVLYEVENLYPVHVLHKRNAGLANARNTGAKRARGEFIAFLDADDMVSPEYYRWAVNILKTYDNISFVGCWTEYFGAAEGMWPTWNPEPPYFLVHNTVNSSALVFKKRDFLLYGLNDPEMEYGMEDYESVIRMVKNGCPGTIIPEPLFQYRIRPDSMSRQFNRDKLLYLYRLITEKHGDFLGEYAEGVFNLLNHNGPGYLYDNPTWDCPPVGFLPPG